MSRRIGKEVYMGIAPTLLASDNKGPVMVIEQRKEENMEIGKNDLTLKVKIETDGFLEKAQAVADARRALDEALDNLENHIIAHTAPEPARAENANFDFYKDEYFNPQDQAMFEAVENALGFKLFFWQKSYILTGIFRQYGATTAMILRDLLDRDSQPIDYTHAPRSNREVIYREELKKIQYRLSVAGIPTRQVLWSEKEKQEYFTNAPIQSARKENKQCHRY